MLRLYTFFHLNLAYSSISEEERSIVIANCYWPILRFAKDYQIPIGIEASGYTLEVIATLDKDWIEALKALIEEGLGEFIGSGYAQIIGPLVPGEVNRANLRLGHEMYDQILGLRPRIGLVNEQAYSAGLLSNYLEAGYDALIMEWDNPAATHPDWSQEWRYYPQYACDQHGEQIPVIWNKSIAFQKFQRFAHGDIDRAAYFDYLSRHVTDSPRNFPLYGNDAEIFDFRPGRFHTEAPVHGEGEWQRIRSLVEALREDSRFQFIKPSQVLETLTSSQSGHPLQLESKVDPIPVKKQGKYNVTRWAVTGRDDGESNAACWRIYQALRQQQVTDNQAWRDLCYLWSSDFRTHITEDRWRAYQQQLQSMERHYRSDCVEEDTVLDKWPSVVVTESHLGEHWSVNREGAFLLVESDTLFARLNCRRGLAIESLVLKHVSDRPLLRTLPHGYYDDIAMAADYYSAHVVFEVPGKPKITDLAPVDPLIRLCQGGDTLVIEASIPTALGAIRKTFLFSGDGTLQVEYELDWHECPVGSLRLGHLTLNPEVFQPATLKVRTHNGGILPETCSLAESEIDQGKAVSFLVSATSSFGMTEEEFEIGDGHISLLVGTSQGVGYLVPMVTCRPVDQTYFCRVSFSGMEVDDTARMETRQPGRRRYALNVSARRHLSSAECSLEQQNLALSL